MQRESVYTGLIIKKKMPGGAPPEQFLLCAVIHCLFSTSEKAITKAATIVNHSLADDLLVTTNV